MKIITKSFLFLYVFCWYPHMVSAYSVTCTDSIKTELWPSSTQKTEVRKLQTFLNQQGYRLARTGVYGQQTINALRLYQKDSGIFPTGGLGAITRMYINQEMCRTPVVGFDPLEKSKKSVTQGVILPVPLIEQSYRLSCEAASMEMILRYKGITKNQTEIMQLIGYASPVIKYFNQGNLIWGDPDLGFVGDEKGWVYLPPGGLYSATGWGVNPTPVTRVLKSFLPNTFSKETATLEDIVAALDFQKPVIFWHKRDDMISEQINYQTPLGKSVNFTSNHVAVIVGYESDASQKKVFWINDPTFGRFSIDQETLIRWWGRMDNKMVVSG